MGPLILLSLLGIGAASAFVDFSPADDTTDGDKSATEAERDDAENEQDAPADSAPNESDTSGDPLASDIADEIADEIADNTEAATHTGTDGDDILHARADESIDAGDGDDTLSSWGSGMVMGGEGSDVFDIGGTAQAHGGAGEDYMHISQAGIGYGGEGDDTFFLKSAQSGDDGPVQADGGDGDDTFVMRPLAGLPEETVAHVLTGGAGADIYALDIDSATAIRPGEDSDTQIVAKITDFDPAEDLLLIDLGASAKYDDVDSLPKPDVTTVQDVDGAFTDVHISWTNPLNPDNVETRVIRLEGVTNFTENDVQLTSVFDPDSHYHDDETGAASAHRLFALTPVEGTDADDTLHLSDSSATVLKDGDDTVEITDGAHLIYGGEGDDSIQVTKAGIGPAQLFGGEGDDELTADLILNNDTALIGGDGDDTITFGMGHYVEANEGDDTLVLSIHENALDQGPAVLKHLTGNHLTINIPAGMDGEISIVNHTYGNGFEVAYSEILVGDVSVLKVLEEDFTTGVGIAEIDPRIAFVHAA